MTDGLKDAHRAAITAVIAANDRVERAVLFGSRATGTNTLSSDVDIALFGNRLTLTDQARLATALDEIPMAQSVDVLLYDLIRDRTLREHIRVHGVEWYAHRKRKPGSPAKLASTRHQRNIDGWADTTLGHVIELKRGYDLPQRERVGGPVPVVSSSGITGYHVESKVPGPGVVTGRYGTLGEVYFVRDDFWPLNTTLYVRDFKGNDPRFVSYWLRKLDFSGHSDKAAVPGLNRNHMHEEHVRIPLDVREQRTIAHILGTLDDKIELIRRMNATLEAIARALFRSWFVDFDPVRAKMEGRDTGLPKEVANLFPDRLVDSELGEIPEGWVPSRLDGVAVITKGRSYRRRELVGSDTALVTLKSFARGGGYRPDGLKPFRGTYKPEQVVLPGDVIVACTDVTQAAEVVGRSAVVGETSSFRTLVASLDVLIVRPKNRTLGRAFVYYVTGTDGFVSHALARTTGTTVLHLSRDAVESFRFALPPRPLVERFEHCADALRARIQINSSAVGLLVDLRDALLPKLVSGELRVNGVRAGERAR